MRRRSTRNVIAIVGAGLVLGLVGWLDTVVVEGIRQRSSQTFDITGIAWALPFGYLAIAGGGAAIVLLARWAQSVTVGLVYALGGAFLVFLFPILWFWAASVNGAAPLLPGPIATFVNEVYAHAESGPLNAVAILGAAMLLAGLATIGSALRHRVPAAPDVVTGSLQPDASSS